MNRLRARNKMKYLNLVNKANEEFDGGMKHKWVGILVLVNQAEQADTGIATLIAQSGKMVSGSKGNGEILRWPSITAS